MQCHRGDDKWQECSGVESREEIMTKELERRARVGVRRCGLAVYLRAVNFNLKHLKSRKSKRKGNYLPTLVRMV
jgi:hypothetical protein